ncbi:MAG: efflux RND transporter periplasmic adaptor subunit [Deltaproteobacteria bacterium]|nr:efflux RND transporter periplasmic adaptor subunit [Deltaproteobacteria bacterium]MCF8120531.1 efflux RND transporter periplasmic adaptor subunit [Deltaproteobacteria bacterium]
MMKTTQDKKALPLFRLLLLTAVLTLMIGGAGAYLLGYLGPKQGTSEQSAAQKEERKVAYWRAPMNPTEIYDKPGKSAMGMDLVPVYEDEIRSEGMRKQKSERKIAYWRSPMNPTEIYDKPGKDTMGMDLVPVYEDELVGGVDVRIDPVVQQNMGIRTARVEKAPLVRTLRTYGNITYDETRTVEVSPKVSGWIEAIHVDFVGESVKKGEPLFELYSPVLFSAQQEYLAAYRSLKEGSGNRGLLESARQKLRYFDIPEIEIDALEASGKIKKTLTFRSPFNGVVVLKNAEEGTHIKVGATVYRIADLSRIWVIAHVYEYELPWVSEGQEAEMSLSYLPGRTYSGKVSYVYPYLHQKTRDIPIRMEFDNPDLTLKPGMYADIIINSSQGEGVVIPSEAVIRSGERNLAFVVKENHRFSPRDLVLGLRMDEKVQVLSGLSSGEVIVTSGNFLIASESKLKEAVQKMMEIKRAGMNKEKSMEEKTKTPIEGKEPPHPGH